MSTSSRSVIYTGQHITGTKMADLTDMPWQKAMSADIPTIGDLMRKAGYYTAYKGKFHMLDDGAVKIPTRDEAGAENSVVHTQSTVRNAENRLRQNDLEVYGFSDWNLEGDIAGSVLDGYNNDEYIQASTVKWLREKGSSLNKAGRPFFLAVNFVNPHDIIYLYRGAERTVMDTNAAPVNTVYAQRYDWLPPAWQDEPSQTSGIPAHAEYQAMWNMQVGALPREEEAVKRFNDYYLNCIQDQDNSLMGLLEELERLHMMDKTIIIFTTDHGEMGGSHGLVSKGNFMYDYNLHVPFLVVHPAYKGGRRIGALTSHLDIAPTILDMTNLPDNEKQRIRKGLMGRSLMPLLDGRAKSVREGALQAISMIATLEAYNPYSGTGPNFNKRGMLRGIVTDRYKFARYFSPLNFNKPTTLEELYGNNDVELYDLKTDPNELKNLAADRAANAGLIEELNRHLNALITLEIGIDDGSELDAAFKFFGVKR
jgi:arylsulfatase